MYAGAGPAATMCISMGKACSNNAQVYQRGQEVPPRADRDWPLSAAEAPPSTL
ncbi:hypothetical protein N9L68_06920 [bacterium]|nr:hypothetical protein [bacterium]